MKESTSKEEKKPFLSNNNAHIFGYINDVRMNPTESGRTAINLDVVTLEQYKDKAGDFQTKRSYHDVVSFTDKQETIDKFAAIAADCEANRAGKGVEGFKPTSHTVSLDGILVNRNNSIGDTDKYTRTVAILAKEDAIKLDVKQQENEVRNRVDFVGNVASIDLHAEKGFAVVNIANHYRPDPKNKEDKGQETWLEVRIDKNRKYSQGAYEAIEKGDLKVGDFIRIGGQLHNNRFETKQGVNYKNVLDLTSFAKIERKEAQAQAQAPAEQKAAKAAEKKETAKKDTTKKATSKKKSGIKMG